MFKSIKILMLIVGINLFCTIDPEKLERYNNLLSKLYKADISRKSDEMDLIINGIKALLREDNDLFESLKANRRITTEFDGLVLQHYVPEAESYYGISIGELVEEEIAYSREDDHSDSEDVI